MDDPRLCVFITGASGLLGKALVSECLNRKLAVLAHYRKNPGQSHPLCRWLQGDFSTLDGMKHFLNTHGEQVHKCHILINNYGPITWRETDHLTGEDLVHDFYHNVVTAFEMTRFCLNSSILKGVYWLGFFGIEKIKPYRKILAYAMAKHSLLFLHESLAARYPHIKFRMISPVTLAGAEVKSGDGIQVSPQSVAREIIDSFLQEK